MKNFKLLVFFLMILSFNGKAQEASTVTESDTMTLAQAYINLYLTETYFDTLPDNRISKILPFEVSELERITDTSFISQNSQLYDFTYSLLYLNKSKLLYRTKNEINRNVLTEWKNTLDKSINYFSSSEMENYFYRYKGNSFFESINFDEESVITLSGELNDLKSEFSTYFNEDIYPDFKRIFFSAKNSNEYHFDSLAHYTEIYGISFSLPFPDNQYWRGNYKLGLKLDLISRYLQLKYLVTKDHSKILDQYDIQQLHKEYFDLIEDLKNHNLESDNFFKKEFTSKVTDILYTQLKRKYPLSDRTYRNSQMAFSREDELPEHVKYFFPNPAPISSAKLSIRNFKPELPTLGQADKYLSTELVRAGFKNQLHYYYTLDGFAMTTSLEKFNKNGTPVSVDSRFSKTLGGEGKFSYYEVFKSLFFEVESEFRMFAFIVASKEVTFSSSGMSAAFAGELLKNSYEALPEDLKIKTLPNKNLSILVYHFHQNDIGEVPMLDLSGEMSVEDHLKNAALTGLIRN